MEREGRGGVDARLHDLAGRVYRADPDRFVEERDRLARQVRDDGDRELAEAVGRLRKPTLPAWAVDQLALRDGDDVGRLFALGDAARGALTDEDRPVREVISELRQLVGDLRDRAGGYLESIGAGRQPHLDEVERTLMAAATDPERRPDVVAGMLTRPLETSGFGALAGLQLAAGRDGGGGGGDPDGDRRQLQEERRRLERKAQQLRGRRDDALRQADDLRARAVQAQQVADDRAAELSDVEARLSDVVDELDA